MRYDLLRKLTFNDKTKENPDSIIQKESEFLCRFRLPWSLTYSARVLQSEQRASPVKPRFSHSLELSCSFAIPKGTTANSNTIV